MTRRCPTSPRWLPLGSARRRARPASVRGGWPGRIAGASLDSRPLSVKRVGTTQSVVPPTATEVSWVGRGSGFGPQRKVPRARLAAILLPTGSEAGPQPPAPTPTESPGQRQHTRTRSWPWEPPASLGGGRSPWTQELSYLLTRACLPPTQEDIAGHLQSLKGASPGELQKHKQAAGATDPRDSSRMEASSGSGPGTLRHKLTQAHREGAGKVRLQGSGPGPATRTVTKQW